MAAAPRIAGTPAGARAAGLWLAAGMTLACLLTAGGSLTTTDAVVTYDVTRGIVERGTLATSRDWIGSPAYRGRDGQYYSPFGIAQSIWNIPFYVAGRAIGARLGGSLGNSDAVPKAVVGLATVPAVSLLGWIAYASLLELGAAPRRAVLIALVLVFATPFWPYSKFGFNQPLTATFLWGGVLAALGTGTPRPLAPLLAGVCAGLALLTRHEMLPAAVAIGVFVAMRAAAARRAGAIAWYLAGYAPGLAAWAALNAVRFGNPLNPGYLDDPTPGFGSSVLSGVAGLLLSPYASLFLYCPAALLTFAGWRALRRRDRLSLGLFAALFVGYLVLYASLGNWMGGRSYGPRYLVPLLPALIIPLGLWSPGRTGRHAALAVVLASVAVQLPGVLVDYSKVRMERAAAGETVAQDMRWAGTPLLLNARASVSSTIVAVRHLSGIDPLPRVSADDAGLSMRLAISLDFWWMHLLYLGVIGRGAAIGIALLLASGAIACVARALSLTRVRNLDGAAAAG
jgi:hypothetical protein